jgi:hypothetical protein
MEENMTETWKKEPPTAPGYYWYRYVGLDGVPREPDIMHLLEPGCALEFGTEHTFDPGIGGCLEFGQKIEPPLLTQNLQKNPVKDQQKH